MRNELDRRLRQRQPGPRKFQEWAANHQGVIRRLSGSMGKICPAVIRANGGSTHAVLDFTTAVLEIVT